MIVIYRPKNSGRTFDALSLCHTNQYIMVCKSFYDCTLVKIAAKDFDLTIPEPITFQQFLDGSYRGGEPINGFVIDNADFLLDYLAKGVQVKAITVELKQDELIGTPLKKIAPKI